MISINIRHIGESSTISATSRNSHDASDTISTISATNRNSHDMSDTISTISATSRNSHDMTDTISTISSTNRQGHDMVDTISTNLWSLRSLHIGHSQDRVVQNVCEFGDN